MCVMNVSYLFMLNVKHISGYTISRLGVPEQARVGIYTLHFKVGS